MTRLRRLLASLDYRDAERMLAFMARCGDDQDELSGVDDGPSPTAQECYRQALGLAALGTDPATVPRLAALAWERFPDGQAFDALTTGRARLADYKRCQTPRCRCGTETPRALYCPRCKVSRQRLQQRLYRHRGRQPRPPCCTARGRCPQHQQAADFARDYKNAWAAGSRGLHRIEWLFGIFDGGHWREGDDSWLADEDREPGARAGERWLRAHGDKSSLRVKGESDAA